MGRWGAVGLAAMVLFGASVARADVRTEARRHFRRGMELVASGRVEAGIAELETAYEILPHPNVLYNIARAYAEAGQYEPALEYFERYLESDPPDREEVNGFIAALRERLAAQQRRESPQPAQPTEPTEPTEPTAPALGPAATAEEIQALEDSATQIATLAEATQSDALRARADRLRQLAQSLRERGELQQTGAGTGAGTTGASGQESVPEADDGLTVGERRQGDTYEEQVVSASRFAQSPLDAPNSTTIVTAQDVRLSGLTNAGLLLRRAPGLEVMELTPADVEVSIRGLNQRLSNKVLILVDGRSAYLDFLGTTLWSALTFSVEDIERIEIIRGPASALYGADAFTGIINVITREPGEGRSFVGIGVGNGDTVRGATSVTGRNGPLAYRFGGGYETTDSYALEVTSDRIDLRPALEDEDQALDRTWFSGELRYTLGDGWRVRAGTGVNQGEIAFQAISRLRQMVATDLLFTQAHLSVTSPVGIGVRTFWNHFGADASTIETRPGAIAVEAQDIVQDVVDVELDWSHQFDFVFQHNFVVGFGYRYKAIDWTWFDRNHSEHHFAAYIQDTMRIAERLQIVASARVDRHPLLANLQFSPRGSVVFRLTPGSAVRGTVGTAFRSPTFLESYLAFENQTPIRAVTALGVGNQELDPERMLSAELGYSNQESDYFALEANVYYNLVDRQIFLSRIDRFTLADFESGRAAYDPSIAAYPVGELRFENEDATFRQIGGELGARVFPVTGLDFYANYAYHDTSPTRENESLGARGDDERTSQHKVNAGVQYRSSFGGDVGVDFHWVSEQVWVEQVTDINTGVRFEAFPLPAYALLNARVGYRLFEDRLELGVVGTNLTGVRHRQHPFGQPIDTRVLATAHFRF